MKIRPKYQLITAALIVSVVVSIAAMVMHTQRKVLHAQGIRRLEAVMEGAGRIAKESYDSSDRLMAVSYLMFLQRTYPEIAFASLSYRGRSYDIGAESGDLLYLERGIEAQGGPVRYTVSAYPSGGASRSTLSVSTAGVSLRVSGRATVKVEEPGGGTAGQVRLGFIRSVIDENVNQELAPLLRWTAGIAGFFLALGLMVNAWVAKLLTGPIEALAQATGLLAAGRMDVSVPVRGRDELGTLTTSFNSMAGRLNELLQSREDILHTLTHEINTPLSGLKGYLELWQDAKMPQASGNSAEILGTMMGAVLRMENSLGNALRLFSGEAKRQEDAEVKPLLIDRIFKDALTIYMPIALANGVNVRPLHKSFTASIMAQEEPVRQIINNLLLNAIKYTPSGGEVSVHITENYEEVTFHVRNTGPGIAPQHIPNLFTKFYRAGRENEGKKKIPGTGLGLSIVHKAVTALGGTIWVESQVDKFTLFQVKLPKWKNASLEDFRRKL
ncbi:MAG: hypothetical protein A2016_10610 [Elusimicrobia bacterium GWF2_62_30]|nr:MAG: hypothetical protein A2016_10610 [Elusimicrobia bacterium GWF2_62_30]